MSVPLMLLIVGFFGFTIAVSMLYNRKVELQTAADAIALAAAAQLNGTDAGVRAALAAAADAAAGSFYGYTNRGVVWDQRAISFSSAPYGNTWVDATSAQSPATALTLFYVKVDTNQLSAEHGDVSTLLLQVFPSVQATAHVASRAIAGRATIDIMPMAVCAMSETPGQARGAELVEYGFRRGVSYDLMQLSPVENARGASYVINPVAPPGSFGPSIVDRIDIIRPFVCTGTLGIPTLAGGAITVDRDFPLASVYEQLNSRFGKYAEPCTSQTAPPDTNVKEYIYSTAFNWLNKPPKGQAAESRATSTQLLTIADLAAADIPPTTTSDMYGPIWVFAKAAKYSGYKEGVPEPANGYATFSPSDWSSLYSPGAPALKPGFSYPSTLYTTSTQSPPGGVKGVANRRVLNIPLLRCPAPSATHVPADVLAIGKFFMTVPATPKELYAEFAGIVTEPLLGGQVVVYP